jgi:DNA-binding MarR family transcriptional regulator
MQIDELHEMPGHLIRRAHQISGARFAANLQGRDLTSVQFAAMVAIDSTPAIDATRIGELIGFDKATLGGVLDRLEAKGLVARTPSQEDRRVKTVGLTDAGRALLSEVEADVRAAQDEMVAPLSTAERQSLIRLLKKMVTGARP